jgi:hypothetical protein
LTVSEDPRLVRTVRELTAKTAETVGVSAGAAARLGAAVERVILALADARRPAGSRAPQPLPEQLPEQIDVRFDVGPDALRVDIACASAGAGWTLERWLAGRGDLDELRALAPDVEVAVAGTPCLCQFTCAYASRA